MADIGFYHLTRTGADQALPQLLGRTLAAGQRALVLCGGPERVASLDAALWLCPDPDWLPHGTAESGHAELQPIWLTATDPGAAGAPNGARFLFLLDGAACTWSTACSTCSTAPMRKRWKRRGGAGPPPARLATRSPTGSRARGDGSARRRWPLARRSPPLPSRRRHPCVHPHRSGASGMRSYLPIHVSARKNH